MITLESRIRGALFGFVIGDAMGATTEFMEPEEIKAKHGVVAEILGGGWLNLERGEVTDDTQMMMCLARAIMKHPDDVTEILNETCLNFAEWYDSNPRDVGATCASVISQGRTHSTYPQWITIARSSDSLGNGSLMRILPSVLSGHTVVLSSMQGMLTHNNAACDYYIKRYHSVLNGVLDGKEIPEAPLTGTSGLVSTTYINALHWAGSTKTFKDAIIGAVNQGGDADTIAALTGGLAGAYHGFEAVPKRWINRINKKVLKEIDEFAHFCHQKVCTL